MIGEKTTNNEIERNERRTADTTNDTVCSISSERKMDLTFGASVCELMDEVGVLWKRVEEEDSSKFTFVDSLDHDVLFLSDGGQHILLVNEGFEFLRVRLGNDDLLDEARVLFGERVRIVFRGRMSHEANRRHRSTQYSLPAQV